MWCGCQLMAAVHTLHSLRTSIIHNLCCIFAFSSDFRLDMCFAHFSASLIACFTQNACVFHVEVILFSVFHVRSIHFPRSVSSSLCYFIYLFLFAPFSLCIFSSRKWCKLNHCITQRRSRLTDQCKIHLHMRERVKEKGLTFYVGMLSNATMVEENGAMKFVAIAVQLIFH